jgi:hypothetical protein
LNEKDIYQMKIQKLSIKRYVLGGFAAAALLVPLASFAGAAQASMGSHGVRGELPAREAQMFGQTPSSPGIFPITQSVQTNTQHLSLSQCAINPVCNHNQPRDRSN